MPPSSPPEADFNRRTSVLLHPLKGQTLTRDAGVEVSLKQTQCWNTQTQWSLQLALATQRLSQRVSLPFNRILRGAQFFFFLKRFLILLYSRFHPSRFLIIVSCGSLSIISRMVPVEASLWCFENVFSSLRASSSSHSLLKVEKDQVKGSLRLSSIEGEALLPGSFGRRQQLRSTGVFICRAVIFGLWHWALLSFTVRAFSRELW